MSPTRAYRLYQRETLGRDLRLEFLDVLALFSPRELLFFITVFVLGTSSLMLVAWSSKIMPPIIAGTIDFAWLFAVLRVSSARQRFWMLRAALVCGLAGAIYLKTMGGHLCIAVR